MDERTLLRTAARLIAEKKGERIVAIDLRQVSMPTSYFLIAEADNPVHVKAILSHLAAEIPRRALHREGVTERRWAVLDYGDVVVHVFQKDAREFYDLESLWSDHIMNDDPLGNGAEDGSS